MRDKTLSLAVILVYVILIVLVFPAYSQDDFEGGGYIHGMVYGFDIYDEVVPLNWAKITVEKDGFIVTTTYSSEGYYEAFVPGGSLTLTVEHGGYITDVSEIRVSPGSSSTINFYMERSEEPIPEFPPYTLQILMGISILAVIFVTMRLKKRDFDYIKT